MSDSRLTPFAIPGAMQRTVSSRTGLDYQIMIWSPDGAALPSSDMAMYERAETEEVRSTESASGAGCPVVYVLDANAVFGTVVECMRLLSRGPYAIEPAVIVGIGYPTDRPLDTKRRFYDYTVKAEASELPQRKIDSPWPDTGGADLFLAFIEEELKPAIEREYSIDRGRQTLIGHSLGGFFALYAMLTRRGSYGSYCAGSPSIWWKNGYLWPLLDRWLMEAKRKAEVGADGLEVANTCREKEGEAGGIEAAGARGEAARAAGGAGTRLYICMGGDEKPHMVDDAQRLYDRLSAEQLPSFTVKHDCLPEEGHLSVILPFLARALRFSVDG